MLFVTWGARKKDVVCYPAASRLFSHTPFDLLAVIRRAIQLFSYG